MRMKRLLTRTSLGILVAVSLLGSVVPAFAATGTPSMTRDINTWNGGSYPSYFHALGTTALFFANDGVHGSEPWRSDGTPAGTQMIADIDPGRDGSSYGPIVT